MSTRQNILFYILIMFTLFSCNNISKDSSLFENFKYRENFEKNELNAWASYPLWQDTAFDPNFRVGKIVPGDSNLSVVQKVTPYTNVDNYTGAQKLFDAYLTNGSSVKLKYYLKSQLKPEFLKIRLAAGKDGKVDYIISKPKTNKWVNVEVGYNDFIKQNTGLINKKIKVNALAILAKFPKADPAMPIYFGIDDVEINALRKIQFSFNTPEMIKLSEWKQFIPRKHYQKNELFSLKGSWKVNADRVSIKLSSFTKREKILLAKSLNKNNNEWNTEFRLSFPEGLFLAKLEAYKGGKKITDTEFTIFIKPENIKGKHPRLWFDEKGEKRVISKLNSNRFKDVKEDILSNAKKYRNENPINSIVYDIDQYPADVLPVMGAENLSSWEDRIRSWREGIYYNALAYKLLGDKKAGEYAKNLMVKISGFPFWIHPWWLERGQYIYYPIALLGMKLATGYDLLYNLMNKNELEQVRNAFLKQVIVPCQKSYVDANFVTNNTSNWVAHITSGSMMCQAAIYDDDKEMEVEPYFTGAIIKTFDMIRKSFTEEGAYGEGSSYYLFTMESFSKSLPAMENVFNIDMSAKINGSYKELIWAGNIEDKKVYYFGDSYEKLRPIPFFAWLLPKYKDPLLGWLYNHLKENETLMDILYETKDVPKRNPFKENPVKFFNEVGTTVFKSGWEKDDFIFVMRTGAFYNHQHHDQGSFWLSDYGEKFIEERHGGMYYADPYFQSWYTQSVAHSTILVNHNHQSQRVGDPRVFAEGFDDHAFLYHHLDGSNTAFSSGDIGKLYWGKVKRITRNVLYLKPRTILMVDVIEPADKDVDVTLLYQTRLLEDLEGGYSESKINKNGKRLVIKHLYPGEHVTKTVQTPHYMHTLLTEKPLKKEGMLTVTANTNGKTLVMANLLTANNGKEPDIIYKDNQSYVSGKVEGRNFIFSTNPGNIYKSNGFETDALTLTWNAEKIFAGIIKLLKKNGKLLVSSEIPVTCEISDKSVKYFHTKKADVLIGVDQKPVKILLDSKEVTDWKYDDKENIIKITLPKGEGNIVIR